MKRAFRPAWRWRALALASCWFLQTLPSAQAADPVAADYDTCVRGAWPTVDDAEARIASCSRALQSLRLPPEEVALARLTRGVARYALGDRVIASDDYQKALQHYDQAIDPRSPDALLLYRRGIAREGTGQMDKALEDFSNAIKAAPQRAVAYLDRGVLLATRMRAFERAVGDFNRVLELDRDNVAAMVARGSAYSELGQYGRAQADLDHAIALAPRSSDAYQRRALARRRAGQEKAALGDYATSLRLNPQNTNALNGRAALEASEGRFDLAIVDLDAAIAMNAENPTSFYNWGYAHFARQEFDKAIADYNLAIALDPRMARAFNNRCLVRAITGKDLVRALNDCDTALELTPLNLDVRATRGFVFLKLGDPQLALNEYNILLERDPNRALALYGRGLALIAAGKTAEGEREKAAGLALDPKVADNFAKYGLN